MYTVAMKTKLHDRFVAILLVAIWNLFVGGTQANDEELSMNFVNTICENSKFRECIKFSKEQCHSAFQLAIKSCPLKYIENLDVKVIDAPCITEKFYATLRIEDKLVVSCDRTLEEVFGSAIGQRK